MDELLKQRRTRIGALTLIFAVLFVLTTVRLAVIVLVDGPRLISLGNNEHTAATELTAVRGPIVDRNGKTLALSAETRSIYARPRIFLPASSQGDLAHLAEMLGLSSAELELRLAKGSTFVWLARHLPPTRAHEIEQLGLPGIGGKSEYKRFYPESNLAAAVVGLAGMDGQGLSGVELQYDKLMRSHSVGLEFYKDALGHPILDSPQQLQEPKLGARLELTIDSSIQAKTENYLAEQVVQSGARRGSAVILNPFTGEVLAIANVGHRESVIFDRLHDGAVQDIFEPGSTVKGLLAAIALQDGITDTSRRIYCEQGQWQLAGKIIHDDGRYGWLSLSEILEVSSNIGAAKLALALGRRRFYDGLTAFGFGHKTGIDLPGEASGMVRPPKGWRTIELANHGFGQGLAVTPIQLATAYAAIANGGLVMRPFVVKAAYDSEGRKVLSQAPQVAQRAISPSIAHAMNQLLRGVVNGRDGTAHLARVADFTVAGKTGTAQMVDPATGTYYRDRQVASFVGFVPAEDPRLVILVVLYDVRRGDVGGLVAAPVFSEIASDALEQMAVAPAAPQIERAGMTPLDSALEFFTAPQERNANDASIAGNLIPTAFAAEYSESPENDFHSNTQSTPDFLGLSLRSALALARKYQLALEVKGDGYVVSQEPRPGMTEKSDTLSNADQVTRRVQIVLAESAQEVAAYSPTPERKRPSWRSVESHRKHRLRRCGKSASEAAARCAPQ